MDPIEQVLADNERQAKVSEKRAPAIAAAIRKAMEEVARGIPTGGRADPPLDHFRHVEEALRGLYRQIMRDQAEAMFDRFKSGFQWLETKAQEDGFHERIYQEFLSRWGGARIAQITETTRRQIVKIIERGLIDGNTLDEIAAQIREAAPALSQTRAAIIARTETHSAAMFASISTAKRSTVPLNKEWVSVEDHRVRDFGEGDGIIDDFSHRIMNGVTVPLDEPFAVPTKYGTTENLMFPGDPDGSAANIIGCRCGQVYVPADFDIPDDDNDDGGAMATPPGPDLSARERLLDQIYGEQAVFTANQSDAFIDAPEDLLKAILASGDIKRMIRDTGAYADFEGGISMGRHTPGSEDYRRVFRHEYGHFVDLRIAQAKNGPKGRFASWAAAGDMYEDGLELQAARSKTFMGDKRAAIDVANRNEAAYFEAVNEVAARYEDATDLLRAEIPEVDPEDIWRLYGATGRSKGAAAMIAAAWQRRDVGQAIADLPQVLSGQRVSHASAFAGLQDTFEASTGGNIRIGFGHGKAYYTSRNKWSDAFGLSARFGRNKYNAFATGQAFANWFEAYGDGNPAAYALYRRLFPRTAEAFEKLIEEFTS